MQPSNFHSHCNFCDGRSFPEDFIKFAIKEGFRAYGFSSHSPLPFETFWNMSASDMDEYIAEIDRLKNKYKGEIEIYTGLEIDYLDESYNPAIPYFQNLPLDYRIASIHFLPIRLPLKEENMVCIDGSVSEFKGNVEQYYGGDVRKIVEHYFSSMEKMIEIGGFDIIGHMDKIYMNSKFCDSFGISEDWFRNHVERILNLIAEHNYIIEINTKNFNRKKETYPNKLFFQEILKREIPIMVNSDSHYPDLVNDGRNDVLKLLSEIGFRKTRELVGGKWKDLDIE